MLERFYHLEEKLRRSPLWRAVLDPVRLLCAGTLGEPRRGACRPPCGEALRPVLCPGDGGEPWLLHYGCGASWRTLEPGCICPADRQDGCPALGVPARRRPGALSSLSRRGDSCLDFDQPLAGGIGDGVVRAAPPRQGKGKDPCWQQECGPRSSRNARGRERPRPGGRQRGAPDAQASRQEAGAQALPPCRDLKAGTARHSCPRCMWG